MHTVQLADGETGVVADKIWRCGEYLSVALRTETPYSVAGWKLTFTALRMLADQTDAAGIPFTVVYVPYQEQVHPDVWPKRKSTFRLSVSDNLLDWDRPRRKLEDGCKEIGVEFLDLTPCLRKEAQRTGALLYFVQDGHLTVRGNEVVADALFEYLTHGGERRPGSSR
jgi:hypothetical protein